MRTLLICHEGSPLDEHALARWLASFSQLVGIVVVREPPGRRWARVRREIRRVGVLRFVDVFAFRVYYRLVLARVDRARERELCTRISERYPNLPDTPRLVTESPNSAESERFIREARPDMAIARCKTLLVERVFSIPALGTYIMHPGVAPEYRNSHGCFWALVRRDLGNVGMTLLRIDAGVDTGPVYDYFTYDYDERTESHDLIQKRVVFENLDGIRERLLAVAAGQAEPLDTAGRQSAAWGQPWLTSYFSWKWHARRGHPA